MTLLLETVPVVVAVGLSLTVALLLSRSLLHVCFSGLSRLVAHQQAEETPK